MNRNDTGMNRNGQFLNMFKRTVLKKKKHRLHIFKIHLERDKMRCYKDAPYYFTLTDTLPSSYASVLFGKQQPR